MQLDKYLNADPLPWLLKEADPNVRYLTLREVVRPTANDPELAKAKETAFDSPLVKTILKAQHSEGYWSKSEPIYADKYKGTVWSFLLLAQLGLERTVPATEKAAEYMFTYSQVENGSFTTNGTPSTGTSVTYLPQRGPFGAYLAYSAYYLVLGS